MRVWTLIVVLFAVLGVRAEDVLGTDHRPLLATVRLR